MRYENFSLWLGSAADPTYPVNDFGEVAFPGRFAPGFGGVTVANDEALFGPGPSGELVMRVRKGDLLPNGEPAQAFGADRLTNAGDILLVPNFLSHRDGSLSIVQGTTNSDPPIGLAAGETVNVWVEYLNENSEASFAAEVRVEGQFRRHALFGPAPSGLVQLVMAEGDPAPGAGTGAVFGSPFPSRFTVNDQRDLAFVAPLEIPGSGPLGDSVWVARAGDLELIALEDTPVVVGNPELLPALTPGPEGQWIFEDIDDAVPALGNAGDVAFIARVSEGLASTAFDGLFLHDPDEGLWLVTRQGDVLPFGSPSSNVVTTLKLPEHFYPGTAFGDAGLAFLASNGAPPPSAFSDFGDQGVFLAVTDSTPVPEPGAVGRVATALALAGLRRAVGARRPTRR